MTIRLCGSEIEFVPFEDATHVLIDTTIGCFENVQAVTYNAFGVAVDAVTVPLGQFQLVYARVDQDIYTASGEVTAIMTRHFNRLYDSITYDDPCNIIQLFRDRSSGKENSRMTVAEADNLPKAKISSAHHFHFAPSEIVAAAPPDDRTAILDLLRLPKDAQFPFAASWLMWCTSAGPEARQLVRQAGLTAAKTTQEFIKMCKSISVEAKSLQNLVEIDLRTFFELEVLVNRVDGAVDWDTEKRNRTEPNVTNIPYCVVRAKARAIFEDAATIGRKPVRMNWDDFWKSRWQWSAAGSIHSQYPEDESYILRSNPLLKNKFITLVHMPMVQMGHFADRLPQIHAWASTKYEWAKQRAIYGTDVTSYTIAHFAFYNCENLLPNQFPVGKDANDANVRARVAGVLKDKLPFCLDFEDFNSQHSISSMAAVIDAYHDVYGQSLSEEQRRAVLWTRDSIVHQVIHDNIGRKEIYEAKGTLLSGWRLTTFMNSVLNYIYTRLLLQQHNRDKASLHNGDDVLIGTRNLASVQLCMRNARKYNVRMQSSKCAYGAIAEFLRIDHRRGSKGQYLARAVSTMVHSRIESKPSTDARDLAAAMEMRFQDAKARGMPDSVIAALRYLYYKRQSHICNTTIGEMYMIKTMHRVVGGISESAGADVTRIVCPGTVQSAGTDLPELPGIRDYALKLHSVLELPVHIKTYMSRLKKATLEAVVIKARKMNISAQEDYEWYKVARSLYKAHKGAITTSNYGKAALVGFGLDLLTTKSADSTLVAVLRTSRRPIEFLEVVT